MSAPPTSLPPTLHVSPRVDAATIYKNKSRLRRCAALSFAAAVEEVQVMVPMPAGRGPQSAFDRDSLQVEFGAAYDGRVVLAGVLVDEVDAACLREDGTVDVDAARRAAPAEAESADSVDGDSDNEAGARAGAVQSSADVRREVEAQLAELRVQLQLNEIALSEATAARDYSVEMAQHAVDSGNDASSGTALATAGVMFDTEMWAAHVDMVAAAKRDFVRRRRELQHEREALERRVAVLESRLPSPHSRRYASEPDASKVVVAVLTLKVLEAVPAGPEAVVYVSYMVQRGAWSAVYEAHLDTLTNEVVLYYNAEVRMNDGEDLQDVELTLSSAAPRRNAALPPTMTIWRCGVVQPPPPPPPQNSNQMEYCCDEVMDAAPCHMLMACAPAPMMARMSAQVEQVGAGGVVNFAIPTPQTVLANGKTTRVPLTELRMPAKISYVCVPEKMPAAFTHAKIKNTSDFLLLTGDVAVFLDGNYVTRSQLGSECASGGTVALDFGVDRSVEVKRVLLRQANRKVQSSYLKGTKNRVRTYAYKITIRNKKRASGGSDGGVVVKVIEHMPVSSEEQLRVRLVSPSRPQEEVYIYDDAADKEEQLRRKARALENDGVVEMEREVRAGETVELLFSFDVESPSTATVYGL